MMMPLRCHDDIVAAAAAFRCRLCHATPPRHFRHFMRCCAYAARLISHISRRDVIRDAAVSLLMPELPL